MAIKQRPDSPTNNFAALNPLVTSTVTNDLRDGNLYVVGKDSCLSTSTIAMTTGKWYWELFSVYSGNVNSYYGVIRSSLVSSPHQYPWNGSFTYMQAGGVYLDSSTYTSPSSNLGFTWPSLSIISFVYDADTGSLSAYKDGVFQKTNTVSALKNVPVVTCYTPSMPSGTSSGYFNFGQDPTFGGASNLPAGAGDYDTDAAGNSTGGRFAFQPPTDALALCTANLPDFTPDVTDDVPKDYFKTVTWTGQTNAGVYNNGNVTVGFQSDLVWVKKRNASSNHFLVDSVSGANKELNSNNTNAQVNNTGGIQSFNSSSFTVGTDGGVNGSSETYVAWCWKAGGNSNTFNINGTGYSTYSALQTANTSLPASSTSGMIVPSGMSINTDAGFSIVKYNANSSNTNGGDVPHGLSKKPDMLIIRPLTASASWIVWHKYLGDNNLGYLHLDLINSAAGTMSYWGTNGITTNSFGLYEGAYSAGTNKSDSGTSPYPHIAYCWHSVEGYSKFGSYTGNGSADGPFVYCGFRPAWVMVKKYDSGNGWEIHDSARDPHNPSDEYLMADESSYSFVTTSELDLLSNGFKIRTNVNSTNDSSGSYIFMAFSEQPFNYANAR